MHYAGVDIGSRSIKVAVIDDEGKILETRGCATTFEPLARLDRLMGGVRFDRIRATGYGRHLLGEARGVPVVSEIKAHALGVNAMVPDARGLIDIGGQDTKAIAVGDSGGVISFEMNDRCAAGTGKFLEVMARAFDMEIGAFGDFALEGREASRISSMCTVFAESEATSLMARGEAPADIALGLHLAVARRAASMVKRVVGEAPLAFTGGVARNSCMRRVLAEEVGREILLPAEPQFAGAYGAALSLLPEGGEEGHGQPRG